VLGCEDDPFHAGILAYSGPLTAIQSSGIEQFRLLTAQAPFHIGESVHIEMNKSVIFKLMPGQLPFRRQRAEGRWRRRYMAGSQNEDKNQPVSIGEFHCNGFIITAM